MAKKKKLPFGMNVDNFGVVDWALFKIGLVIFSFFLVSAIPGLARWITATHWGYFLAAFVVIWIYIVPKVFGK